MTSRLIVKNGQTAEAVRRRFDGRLGVPRWVPPGRTALETESVDSDAPWWWNGAEEASQGFLKSMGVNL